MLQGDIILIAIVLVLNIGLFILAGIAEKFVTSKWRVCYAVPAVICLVIVTFTGFEPAMLGAYIGALLPLAGYLKDSKPVRRAASILSAAAALVSFVLCSNWAGYRAADYADDFKTAFTSMKQHYILAEHKGINWDELYAEYLPKFEAATKNHSETENYKAWLEFSSEFRDGHVGYVPDGNYEALAEKLYNEIFGNDYGLSVMTLADGTNVAVNVDESLKAIGISNGTIITAWDGKNPADLGAELTKYSNMVFADKDNEMFYRAVYGSGVGSDTVTVAYLDKNGNEQSAVLPKLGSYYSGRMKSTLEIINGGIDTGHLMWTDINDKTVALRLKLMMFDSDSMKSDNMDRFKTSVLMKIEELQQNTQVENIILDMRDNMGGSGSMVQALAEIFTPAGEHYYCTDGLWDAENKCYATDPETGKYLEGTKNFYTGEGIWKGQVIILVNANSVSAGDHTVVVMDEFDNITVMGFTEPNGSAQGIGGVYLDNGMFQFSSALLLDENGDISVDSGVDFESGDDVEIKIPFDSEAVTALFDNNEDYLLNKALEYLETK